MKNPYDVLDIAQDASREDIIAAQKKAMLIKKFILNDIVLAAKTLLSPEKRLAADFMFPAKLIAKRPTKVETEIVITNMELNSINQDAFDSLNSDDYER